MAAAIVAGIKFPERRNELYRWVHIASTGRAPANQEQSLSSIEMSTAHRWFDHMQHEHFDARKTMDHYRRCCTALACYVDGNTTNRSLQVKKENPLLK